MTGFAAWVASPAGTLALAACEGAACLVLGLIVGTRRGCRLERRAARERREARQAAQWLRRLRPPEIHHEPPFEYTYAMAVAHEWDQHVERALTGVNPDPSVTAWTQRHAEELNARIEEQHAETDRFLEELFRLPGSGGGQ